jgi:hypothetical protein
VPIKSVSTVRSGPGAFGPHGDDWGADLGAEAVDGSGLHSRGRLGIFQVQGGVLEAVC